MLNASIRKTWPDFAVEVDFTLENGILVLFGPSGCGKSTILNCVSGLQRPDSGRISLGSRQFFSSADRIDLPARKRRIGYVFQEYALFPHMTVSGNMLYGTPSDQGRKRNRAVEMDSVLDMLKIGHLRDRYPSSLSGGEKQRVAVARALLTEPDLLLLDEPLSALDSATRKQLRSELKQLQRSWGIPFLLVTHSRQEMTALADDVLYLDRGRRCCRHHDPSGSIALEEAV